MLELVTTKKSDDRLLDRMKIHYSEPWGFVGRSICYAIIYSGIYYGHIVGGSATRFLPGRNAYLRVSPYYINEVVNNIFYNISKVNGEYPRRNFTSFVLASFVQKRQVDWENKYKDRVKGFEALVEKPRTGELYRRAGWKLVGETKGYTCRREAGDGGEEWGGGRRIWNRDEKSLRPKLVFCFKVN